MLAQNIERRNDTLKNELTVTLVAQGKGINLSRIWV